MAKFTKVEKNESNFLKILFPGEAVVPRRKHIDGLGENPNMIVSVKTD